MKTKCLMFRTYEPSVNALEGSRSIQNTGSFGSEICEIDKYKSGKKEILLYKSWNVKSILFRMIAYNNFKGRNKQKNKQTYSHWVNERISK